jgi:hypothetical protein
MVFEQLSEGIPTACTTIEEVRPGADRSRACPRAVCSAGAWIGAAAHRPEPLLCGPFAARRRSRKPADWRRAAGGGAGGLGADVSSAGSVAVACREQRQAQEPCILLMAPGVMLRRVQMKHAAHLKPTAVT